MLYRYGIMIVEAEKFSIENKDQIFNWITCNCYPAWDGNGDPALMVQTPVGEKIVQLGDWVIKMSSGFFVCDPKYFEAVYELVDEAEPSLTWSGSRL